jgi:hypothetical protein
VRELPALRETALIGPFVPNAGIVFTCRCARWWPKSKQQGRVTTMKQTTRKKKTVKVFSDLKQSLHEALAYEQGKKGSDPQILFLLPLLARALATGAFYE